MKHSIYKALAIGIIGFAPMIASAHSSVNDYVSNDSGCYCGYASGNPGSSDEGGYGQVSDSQYSTSDLDSRAVTLSHAMRKLWEDHITWTRLFIVESVAGAPSAKATATRLFKNQEDIGNAIKPYYGDAAGNLLTALLKEHIQLASDILDAAKANDQTKLAQKKQAWYDNANQIAGFLNHANPDNWPLDSMQMHMKDHLDLTMDEAVQQLQGNYAASIADYDRVHTQILTLADTLTEGIIAQFPDRF